MPIILKQTLSASSPADKYDTRQIKNALNRLGYYIPYEKAGITQYPDEPLFTAIKKFQKDNNIPVTGIIKPDDTTLSALNKAIESAPNGYYIWHTVKDGKARSTHSALDGTMRKWSEKPYPESEFNCRCWGENIPTVNKGEDRVASILKNTPAVFDIKIEPNASYASPIYERNDIAKEALRKYEKVIEKKAGKYNVDADLVKAIMWSEHSRGGYLGLGYYWDKKRMSDTIMPMNINKNMWYKLISNNPEDIYNPEKNIEAGVVLIGRITDRIVNPTPEKIATIWQGIRQENTNDYAYYVQRIYNEKPWKNK